MNRMDIGRALEQAWRHMADMLFRPFNLRMWLALGFTYLVAYSLAAPSGNGVGSFQDANTSRFPSPGFPELRQYLPLIVVAGLLVIILALVLSWLASVFQFIYTDNVARRSGAVAEPFRRLMGRGTSYLLWRLAFGLAVLVAAGILIGLPLALAFAGRHARSEGLAVLAVLWAVGVGLLFVLLASIVDLFARDFLVPTMYVRGTGVIQGWRTVLPVLWANAGETALYVLVVIGIAIAIGITSLILSLLLLPLLLILIAPAVALAVVAAATAHAGVTASLVLIIAGAVFMGLIALAVYSYLISCVMQPAYVFRRAFPLALLGQAAPSLMTVPVPPRTTGP